MLISLVIPLANEVESLDALHRELDEVARKSEHEFEIIFIDDGSTDDSWGVIRRLAADDPRRRTIRFRRNFGKAAGLTAGFEAARGDIVFTLDADLQDDPHEIPRFLAAIDGGLDLVSGSKQVRHDPWHKVFPSHVFNWLVSKLTGVTLHDHNCGFKCYRREVTRELNLYGGMYRFTAVLAAARGFKVGELVVHHRARTFGHSHYGASRFIKGLFDLLTVWFRTQFGEKPQYFFGTIALAMLGVAIIGRMFDLRLVALGGLVLFVQMLATGLVAEMLTAQNAARKSIFAIAERVGEPVDDVDVVATSAPLSD